MIDSAAISLSSTPKMLEHPRHSNRIRSTSVTWPHPHFLHCGITSGLDDSARRRGVLQLRHRLPSLVVSRRQIPQ
jgi:hypothetical protein